MTAIHHRLSHLNRRWLLLVCLLLGLVAAFFVAVRLNQAPDIFTDELLYSRAGVRVANENALVWDSGRPLVIHPPLYFLIEGAFLKLTAGIDHLTYVPGDVFALVHYTRWLNVVFAGLTAAVFFWLGYRLQNWPLGLLMVALFILDPFGLRINRRAMLETLTGLLLLSGMAVLLTGRAKEKQLGPVSWPRAVVAGLLLGAAMLTKDLAFTAIVVVFLYGLWEWWRSRRRAPAMAWSLASRYLLAAAVATLSYAVVPAWALLAGHWQRFIQVKSLALQRLVGLVQLTGWNRPGVSILDFLLERLVDYGSSYLLLALGGLCTILLLLFWRRSATGRLLGLWGLALFPFYGFVAIFGSGNDQFFYLLLLPAIVIVASTAATFPYALSGDSNLDWLAIQKVVIVLLLLVLLPYNLIMWTATYLLGRDDGYQQLVAYVDDNLPPGEPINASGDALKYTYFLPDRPVTDAGTPEEAMDEGVRYFVLAPKDVQARYGNVTPELALWIAVNGRLLFETGGASYGDIYLYQVDHSGSPAPAEPATGQAFAAAQGAGLTPLLIMMAAWFGLWALLAVLLYWRGRPIRPRTEPRWGPHLEWTE